ncbi:hypothetical protein [Streptomyces sp. NPDC050164]|uniref:hypothetical protein n=1 Tax=Streptomyces sp. NPDC050164 TaxID=3365605 RepID=UPI0037B10872
MPGDPDTGRAVGEPQRRDAEPLHPGDVARLSERARVGGAVQQGDLLVEGETREQPFDAGADARAVPVPRVGTGRAR